MRFRKLVLAALLITALAGCGYRLAARKGDVGAGRTIAVPTFANNTISYRIEQGISEALRKELARTTHFKVTSVDSGDLVVRGEVTGYGISPTVFDDGGRAAQYAVSVSLKVVITETGTGKILLQTDSMTFSDTFQLSKNSSEFVPEDPAAINRIAERFASAIVSALVHRPS